MDPSFPFLEGDVEVRGSRGFLFRVTRWVGFFASNFIDNGFGYAWDWMILVRVRECDQFCIWEPATRVNVRKGGFCSILDV